MGRVEVKDIDGQLRLVDEGTSTVSLNSRTNKPLDGGGKKATDAEGAASITRQAGYVNDAFERKHGKVS